MLNSEFAPAKINLTLEILGRRPDGYHEIRSLTAFASDVGDRLALSATPAATTSISGPFATDLAGENLIDKALAKIRKAVPGIEIGAVALEKNLPVASGIGGGSADAAAALRLLARAYPAVAALDLAGIAKSLGADVPVCLTSKAAIMTGIGEHVQAVSWSGEIHAVLVNPLVEVPKDKTAQVFKRLAAAPLDVELSPEPIPMFADVRDVLAYAAGRGNGLEKPARELFPVLEFVLTELSRLEYCRVARLSGAGPTCFGIFDDAAAAREAATELLNRNPTWWISSTPLV